jgi:hypothetical protein
MHILYTVPTLISINLELDIGKNCHRYCILWIRMKFVLCNFEKSVITTNAFIFLKALLIIQLYYSL